MPLFTNSAPKITSPIFTLAPGESFVPPTGWYWHRSSPYSTIQRYDAVAQFWRSAGHDSVTERLVYFDGYATRVSNPTGLPAAAVVTTAGSGYTNAPTVTASAGSSSWTAIVGGALSTTMTISAAGSNYTYPPIVMIDQPPSPGVQATAVATISNGAVATVTVVEQGAGYIYPPNVTVINDPRDTSGNGAQLTAAITGAGTITAVICTNGGTPLTAVPTLSFSAGSAAATVVMDWTITGVTITTAGAGFTASAGFVTATGAGGYVTAAPAYLGSASAVNAQRYWPAVIAVPTNGSGAMSGTPAIIDGGRYQTTVTPAITSAQPPTTNGVLTYTYGGANATVYLVPAQQ